MENNSYLSLLKKSDPKKIELKKHHNKVIPRTIEIKRSPRMEILEEQKRRCFLCNKSFGTSICNFAIIEGPDPKTKEIERKMRALCQECYFKSKKA